MKTVELTALAVAVLLDNLQDLYITAQRKTKEGKSYPALQMLMAAYEEAENALKAAQKAEG